MIQAQKALRISKTLISGNIQSQSHYVHLFFHSFNQLVSVSCILFPYWHFEMPKEKKIQFQQPVPLSFMNGKGVWQLEALNQSELIWKGIHFWGTRATHTPALIHFRWRHPCHCVPTFFWTYWHFTYHSVTLESELYREYRIDFSVLMILMWHIGCKGWWRCFSVLITANESDMTSSS